MALIVRLINYVCKTFWDIYEIFNVWSRNYEKVGILPIDVAVMVAWKIFAIFYSEEKFMSNKEDKSAVFLWII